MKSRLETTTEVGWVTRSKCYAPSRSVVRARYDTIRDVMAAVDDKMTSATKGMARTTTTNVSVVR
jgi:hypothetical protein